MKKTGINRGGEARGAQNKGISATYSKEKEISGVTASKTGRPAAEKQEFNVGHGDLFGADRYLTKLPVSLNIVSGDGLNVPMLKKGESLPVETERVFMCSHKIPSAVSIVLTWGEDICARPENTVLKLRLGGIQKTAGGVAKTSVRVSVSDEGELYLEAFDHGSHHRKEAVLGSEWIPEEEKIEKEADRVFFDAKNQCILKSNSEALADAKNRLMMLKLLSAEEKSCWYPEQKKEIKEAAKELKKLLEKARPEKMDEKACEVLAEKTEKLAALLEG